MRFVADGYHRNLTARRGEIRAAKRAVREHYADALSRAGFFRRIMLWCQLQAEIRREIRRLVPRWALYAKRKRGL
ncbi:MAG: hypothetical protein K6U03_09275 [Firmicutes bacterium]|nr:hypothetical protein [Bacillota bacterium]